MSLSLRIFLTYFFIVGVTIFLLVNVIVPELKPGVRQSTEEALVEMANVLAELATSDFVAGRINEHNFAASVERFIQRAYDAKIHSVDVPTSSVRIYITDKQGIVRYDSQKLALGEDYSQWNDVYLTLRGRYGARSTRTDANDEFSAVMHVAAPLKYKNEIVGVLTVAKPNRSVQPFINSAKEKIQIRGISLVALSLLAAIVFSYWLTRSIRKLVSYSDDIARGERTTVPELSETELAKLASAIDNMRRQLEGKDYVEKYVHALTHELKSPITAIKGASEIINPQMPEQDISHFMENIQFEVGRIDEMINRLLALVTVESRDSLEKVESVDLVEIIKNVIDSKQALLVSKQLKIETAIPGSASVDGDRFLLTQLVDNVLQNAIDFSFDGGLIKVEVKLKENLELNISDQGAGIPDYAMDKIFGRFYSLARPVSNKKSSGLGLCFVKQIVDLHNGDVTVHNGKNGGVEVSIKLRSK